MNAYRIITVILLIFSLFTSTVFAIEDYSYWDSRSPYPPDTLNTKYHSAVRALVDSGVITGDEDGLFHPEKSISRAEFAAIIARATHQQNVDNSAGYFTDLLGYGWAAPYINRCYEQNWIRGVGGTLFAPGKDVTYAEAITVLIRVQRGGQREELVGKWPDVYIQYADMYNLTGTVEIVNWNAPAQKGDIAILTNRMITQVTPVQTNRSAAFSNVVISGASGTPLSGQSVSIFLSNDLFSPVPEGMDITSWFSDLASLGLSAKVASYVMEGMSIITVNISGTPNKALSTEMAAFIPSYYLKSGSSVNVSSGKAARIEIVE